MILYKYYPINLNTIRSLAVRGLWCHYPSEMNDPLECLAGFPVNISDEDIQGFLKRLSSLDPGRARRLDQAYRNGNRMFFESLRDNLIKHYAFCSLSERPDDLLMWSHYADQHRGLVIGIDFSDDINGHLIKVQYADSAVAIPIDDSLTVFDPSLDETAGKLAVCNMLRNITTKASCWQYEGEWRIWRKSPQYYKYTSASVASVFIGVRCPPEICSAMTKLLDYLPDDFIYRQMELKYDPIRLES
jgi:hypothetical protein